MTGWTVPGFTGLRTLGSGGSGEVVLARRDASGTLVAIKYLRHTLLSDAGFRSQFCGEADALAAVDDPNVVRLHEYVRSPRGVAVVMELIDGVSLRDILAHQGKTTAQAALAVLQGSLLGLAAAHQHGVVHRDYKPENVLINGDGDSKLTDFGIAARTGDCPAPAGTMIYAAPEQLSGSPASPAGDVYAATATFYECLAGRPPFTGDTAERLLYQHLAEPVLLDPVPRPLRPLISVGLATNPADRPDAATLLTELTAIASATYGPHWDQHGRLHLGQTALLLAVLWPSSTPPALRDTATGQISLSRRITGLRAAVAVGAVALVAAASTALAVGRPGTRTPAHSIAAAQRISLRPSSPSPSSRTAVSSSSPAALTTTTPPALWPTPSQAPSSPQPSPEPGLSRKPSPSLSPSPPTKLHLPSPPSPPSSPPSPSSSPSSPSPSSPGPSSPGPSSPSPSSPKPSSPSSSSPSPSSPKPSSPSSPKPSSPEPSSPSPSSPGPSSPSPSSPKPS